MIEELDFETYLFISPGEFKIYLFDKKNLKNLYENKLILKNHPQHIDYNILNNFLEENIFKIEKHIGGFLKKISLVIKNIEIINIYIGVKKKNYKETFNQKYLENMLTEVRDIFKENYQNKKILHILVNKYFINDKYQPMFDKKINSDSISLEVQFIAISKSFVFEINKILEKFHVKSDKWFDEKYVQSFFKKEDLIITEKVFKIHQGINDQEVQVVPKIQKKVGFFERFFQLFS